MDNLHQILEKYWGYKVFRPQQEEIMQSVIAGKDTLALLPTGGGKSICYQVPTLAQEGLCLVVSPLIALMKDQVENLQRRNIKAFAINATMTRKEINVTLDNCAYGKGKFLYISPERLSADSFREYLQKLHICLIAVDEAHCISQWGYDFRPPYLRIAEIRSLLPDVPVLALTATATPQVQSDIQEKLLFKENNVLKTSFRRENLSYVVFHEENKLERMLNIVRKVGGSGIIYVRNRRKTKEISTFLNNNNIQASFYHAGLTANERDTRQNDWVQNKTRVIVATNAFGMGIDKPDVRFVIHLDLPDSPEAYFQEAGRAGRDGRRAYAVVLYINSDIKDMQDQMLTAYPNETEIKNTYQALANYFQLAIGSGEGVFFDFDFSDFCNIFNLQTTVTFSCLKILELEGFISNSESFYSPAKLMITTNNSQVYDFQVRHPDYEPLIKAILRSYEGIYTEYRKINEHDIAKRCGLTIAEVEQKLAQLCEQGLLDYIPAKNSPQITFNIPRLSAKALNINNNSILARKNNHLSRIKAISDYVTDNITCRSIVLSKYFGEENPQKCGICDICIEERKILKSEEIETLKIALQKILLNTSLSIQLLAEQSGISNYDKSLAAIRFLIDEGFLIYTPENKIALKVV